MSTLMILQCTGAKEPGGQPMPVHDPFAETLGPIRNRLLAQYPQPSLDNGQLLPAYERHGAGQLYRNMDTALLQEKIAQGSLRVIIISALFGVLEFNTPIPNYYLQAMGIFIPPGITNLGAQWIPYNRGAEVANTYVNPFLKEL